MKSLKAKQRRLDNLYKLLSKEISTRDMAIVYEIVGLELELEAESNK